MNTKSKRTKAQTQSYRRVRKQNKPPPLPLVTKYPKTTVQPVSRIEEVVFSEVIGNYNNPGGGIVSDTFLMNDGYDFKPTILTPTLQFLNYMFTLYSKAKVLYVDFFLEFGNREQSPLDIYFFAAPNNLTGSLVTKANVEALSGTGICVWHQTMSEQYSKSRTVFRKRLIPGKCLGNMLEYNGSESYLFTQSSNPGNLIYGAWAVVSPDTVIPTGITVKVTAVLHTLFYSMRVINFPALSPETRLSNEELASKGCVAMPSNTNREAPTQVIDFMTRQGQGVPSGTTTHSNRSRS